MTVCAEERQLPYAQHVINNRRCSNSAGCWRSRRSNVISTRVDVQCESAVIAGGGAYLTGRVRARGQRSVVSVGMLVIGWKTGGGTGYRSPADEPWQMADVQPDV